MEQLLGTRRKQEVYESVKPAANKWELIARGLGLHSRAIEQIKLEHKTPESCLQAIIHIWLKSYDDSMKLPTWHSLINILKSKRVGEKALADSIKLQKGKARQISKTQDTVQSTSQDDEIKLPVTTEKITHVSSKISGLNYISPSNVFQQHKQSLLLGISCTERLANDLCHADLVSDQVRDEVRTTPSLSRYQRANRLLSNFEQYLKIYNEMKSLTSFCDVLKQQDDPTVARISDEILEMLGNNEMFEDTPRKLETHLTENIEETHGKLERHVRGLYSAWSREVKYVWPPTLNVEFVNLELMKQDKIPQKRLVKDVVRQSQQGKISSIVADSRVRKKMIALEEITNYEEPRKVILIEGAPGIGKTTVASKICQDWAKNMSFTQFSLVLYIPLHVPQLRVAENTADLLEYFAENCSTDDMKFIQRNNGKGVLFILDGWDELKPSCRDLDMFFPRFIQGHFLSECSIIITSRPFAAAWIKRHSNRIIDILGFTDEQVKQYIYSYFREADDNGVAENLIKELEAFPNVLSTCYVAINLAIVCYVYQVDGYKLPSTLTDVYDQFVLHAVTRTFIKDDENHDVSHLDAVDSIRDFKPPVNDVLRKLGKLALGGIRDGIFSFTRDELFKLCHVQEVDFDGYGLLKFYQMFRRQGVQFFCYFLHLTIQEFLAAYSIFSMDEMEQWECLRNIVSNDRYELVVKFFCGLDQFNSRPASVAICKNDSLNTDFVLECAYEGQWKDCKSIAAKKSNTFTFTNKSELLPYQALVYGYVMANSGAQCELSWNNCDVGERELKNLHQFLKEYPRALTKVSILHSSLPSSLVVCALCQIIETQWLTVFTLSHTCLSDDAFQMLFEGVSLHQTLTILCLKYMTLTENKSVALTSFLIKAKLLHCLDLRGCNFEGNYLGMFSALQASTVQELHFPALLKDELQNIMTEEDALKLMIYYYD